MERTALTEKDVRRLEQMINQRSSVGQWEYVEVVFNSVANNDTIITHKLRPVDHEDVDFEVMGWEFASAPATAPVAYRDIGAARKAWGAGYIVLRCNVASARVTLRLTVRES